MWSMFDCCKKPFKLLSKCDNRVALYMPRKQNNKADKLLYASSSAKKAANVKRVIFNPKNISSNRLIYIRSDDDDDYDDLEDGGPPSDMEVSFSNYVKMRE